MYFDYTIPNTVTIHQPHFLPWLPYFARVACAQYFVVLDDVQYRRYYYQNRTRVVERGEVCWLSIPVARAGSPEIGQIAIQHSSHLRRAKERLRHAYKGKPHFRTNWHRLEAEFRNKDQRLLSLNVRLLKSVFACAGLHCPDIVMSSALHDGTSCPTKRIINICGAVKAKTVLIGWGKSKQIHDLAALQKNGLRLVSQQRVRPVPVEGLSVLHDLFVDGPDRIRKYVAQQRQLYVDELETGTS